jgi:hypothetical protein
LKARDFWPIPQAGSRFAFPPPRHAGYDAGMKEETETVLVGVSFGLILMAVSLAVSAVLFVLGCAGLLYACPQLWEWLPA